MGFDLIQDRPQFSPLSQTELASTENHGIWDLVMRPLPANIHAVQIVTEVRMVPSVSFLAQGGEAGNRRYDREVPGGRLVLLFVKTVT